MLSDIFNNVSDNLYLDYNPRISGRDDWEFIGYEDEDESILYKNSRGNIKVYYTNRENENCCAPKWDREMVVYNDDKPAVFNFGEKESIEEYVVKI